MLNQKFFKNNKQYFFISLFSEQNRCSPVTTKWIKYRKYTMYWELLTLDFLPNFIVSKYECNYRGVPKVLLQWGRLLTWCCKSLNAANLIRECRSKNIHVIYDFAEWCRSCLLAKIVEPNWLSFKGTFDSIVSNIFLILRLTF